MQPNEYPQLADGIGQNNVVLVPDAAKDIFYDDVPDARAEEVLATLVPHSVDIHATVATYAAYKHVKATYLLCEQDKALSPSEQRIFLASAGEEHFTVHNLNTSHSPFLSDPDVVSDLIQKAAVEA